MSSSNQIGGDRRRRPACPDQSLVAGHRPPARVHPPRCPNRPGVHRARDDLVPPAGSPCSGAVLSLAVAACTSTVAGSGSAGSSVSPTSQTRSSSSSSSESTSSSSDSSSSSATSTSSIASYFVAAGTASRRFRRTAQRVRRAWEDGPVTVDDHPGDRRGEARRSAASGAAPHLPHPRRGHGSGHRRDRLHARAAGRRRSAVVAAVDRVACTSCTGCRALSRSRWSSSCQTSVMFVPLGFLLAGALRPRTRRWVVPAALLVSIGIEVIQGAYLPDRAATVSCDRQRRLPRSVSLLLAGDQPVGAGRRATTDSRGPVTARRRPLDVVSAVSAHLGCEGQSADTGVIRPRVEPAECGAGHILRLSGST